MFVKCSDYIFDPKVTQVQFADENGPGLKKKQVTITGLLKGINADQIQQQVKLLSENLNRSPLYFYYPSVEQYLEADLDTFTLTPDVDGKKVAYQIKLIQAESGFLGELVEMEIDNLVSGDSFNVIYEGSMPTQLRLEVRPSSVCADLLICNALREQARFLDSMDVGDVLVLDQVGEKVLLNEVDVASKYWGDLFSLSKGVNQFVLAWDRGATLDIKLNYQVRYW